MSASDQTGTFTLLYFASASSYTGKDIETFSSPLPLSRLFDILESHYPGMKHNVLSSCLVTVNLEYVDMSEKESKLADIMITADDEVAIIPPVSSG
jgi:molybdopterin converting factor small subunit